MPLKLIPPGKRKGNRFWLARGVVAGKLREFSTGEVDKAAAERFALVAGGKIADGDRAADPKRLTFAQAAERYTDFRALPKTDRGRIDRLAAFFGTKTIGDITHGDLVAAAERLYAGKKASTKNRCVIAPAAAILHYAASNGWCPYRRFARFKEPKPVTRAVAPETMRALIVSAEGEIELLLIVLFGLGLRITDTLRIDWHDVDLHARTVAVRIGKKAGEKRTLPLPDEVWEALANAPNKTGALFPWRSRGGAYKALRKALPQAKGKFTPHMARHTLGTLLNAGGAGLKTIMAALAHDDPKSSLRYQDADIEIVRMAQRNLGHFMGTKRKAS